MRAERAAARSTLRTAIGPGLLMAGAAVGVSHLVQSTRAGAEYGLAMIAVVIIGCALKFPFLEFGPRYAAATGESMLAGYRRMGRWALGIYAAITVVTMFIITASVTLVTAGLTGMVFGLEQSSLVLSLWVLSACSVLLAVGHYRTLDRVMKVVMALLALTTLVAVVLAVGTPVDWSALAASSVDPRFFGTASIAFVLALLGWMPIPLDAAAWHSLWTLERARQTGHRPSVREAGIDFRIGYIGAATLAVAFLLLGALTMFGSDVRFSDSAVGFAGQFADLYALSLGEWARPLIAAAALATMFSTTITVVDAFPRVLRGLLESSGEVELDHPAHRARYLVALVLVVAGGLAVIAFFGQQFTVLIDFTTTVSFLAAPIIAGLNLKLLTGPHTPPDARPGTGMVITAWLGLAFLIAFCAAWLAWRLLA